MSSYSSTTGNNIVDEIGAIPLHGCTIHFTWSDWIKFENGKPNAVALIILAEIVDWYKPCNGMDEDAGGFTSRKKFKGERLVSSYKALANQFGFTKRQVQNACHQLRDLGCIVIRMENKRDFETGAYLAYMTFEPVPEKIKFISSNTNASLSAIFDDIVV